MSQNNDKSLDELEADIAQTRQNLGQNVEALSNKLSPERFRNSFKTQTEQSLAGVQEVVMDTVNEVTDNVAQRAQEAGGSFFDMVRRHPLPTALIGAGVVLLAAGGGVGMRRANEDEGYVGYGTRYGYGEGDYTGYVRPGFGDEASAATGYTEPDHQVRSRYGQGYGDPQGFQNYGQNYGTYEGGAGAGAYRAGSLEDADSGAYGNWSQDDGSDLRDRAGSAARQARAKTKDAGRGLAGFIESQPLVAGLITAILGALIGLSLPGTRQEDEFMGDARDHLAEQAKEAAERARQVAQKTFDEAKETAKEEFSKVADDAKAEGKNLVQEGKDAAKKVADDAKETAKNESNKQKPS